VSYPVSTVPQVLAYLQTAFQAQFNADPNPQDIVLWTGDPGMEAPPVIVTITGVTRITPHFAMVGDGEALSLEEKYVVNVKVSCAMSGTAQATISPTLTARAWQIQAYVEKAVRLDPSLGGIVLLAWPGKSNGGSPVWSPNGKGMICEITSGIDVENTI
jgi:hypothetical protein